MTVSQLSRILPTLRNLHLSISQHCPYGRIRCWNVFLEYYSLSLGRISGVGVIGTTRMNGPFPLFRLTRGDRLGLPNRRTCGFLFLVWKLAANEASAEKLCPNRVL